MKKEVEELMQADNRLAQLSDRYGGDMACIVYSNKTGVLLILAKYASREDKKYEIILPVETDYHYTLRWQAEHALLEKSGIIGYTYGIWTYEGISENGQLFNQSGTYTSIWEKDRKGNWKIALTGNKELTEKPRIEKI